MSTPTKGVPVTLDKKRHLRYPIGVLNQIREGSGLDQVLYLGLRHEDPDLTVKQVGEMIDLESLPRLAEPLRKATGGLIDLDRLLTPDGLGKPPAPGTDAT